MKATKYDDGASERKLLAAVIADDFVCGRLSARWHGDGLFASKSANLIAGWAVEHHRRYKNAPGRGIGSYLQTWAERNGNHDIADSVGSLLAAASDELERNAELNSKHVADLLGDHLNLVRLKKLRDDIDAHIEARHGDKGWEKVIAARKIEMGVGAGIDLFQDHEAMRSTYDKVIRDPLAKYEGDLGLFFGDQLSRGSFVAFCGPEKAGKSYWMLDVAWRCMSKRKHVAWFQCGDLTESQIKDRLIVRGMNRPSRSSNDDGGWPCEEEWPVSIRPPDDEDSVAKVEYKTRRFNQPLQNRKNWEAELQERVHKLTHSPKSRFRLSCHSTKSISVAGIRSIIDGWMQDGWTPDVVVVDYADILAPMNRRDQRIDQIKMDWEELRKLNADLNCLLVTGTQANANSYKAKTTGREHFSGNHLKHAEVTAMIGINVTGKEKECGICRLNYWARREGQFSTKRIVHVAGCLGAANPAIVAYYPWAHRKKEIRQ